MRLIAILPWLSACVAVRPLPGAGDGGFVSSDGNRGWVVAGDIDTGSSLLDITLADVDHDGRLDLLTLNGAGENSLRVHPGTGDGRFGAARRFPVGWDNGTLTSADLDGDGNLDVVAVGRWFHGPTRIVELFGDGRGGFRGPHEVALDATNANSIGWPVARDFDGDGWIDIAAAFLIYGSPETGNLIVLRGGPGGALTPQPSVPLEAAPASLAAGDLDDDDRADLVVGVNGSAAVLVLLGDGTGGFSAPRRYQTAAAPAFGERPTEVIAADFDGDGSCDVAAVGMNDGELSVLRSVSGGMLLESAHLSTEDGYYHFMVAADFDGDGRVDLCYTRPAGLGLAILGGNGDGSFAPPQPFVFGPQRSFNRILSGDLDGDSRPDLVLGATGADLVTAILNR